MLFDSAAALRQLVDLHQQIIDTPRLADFLQRCEERTVGAIQSLEHRRHGISPRTRIGAFLNVERHVRAMALNTRRLRDRIIPMDGLGDELQSLSELALRTARMIVLTELDALRAALRHGIDPLQVRTLCWGAFGGVDGMADHVRGTVQQIVDTCMAARALAATDRVAYRTALRAAHAGMRHLGGRSAFAMFLHEARRRGEWPALQQPCTRMREALVLRIDVDVDAPLLVHGRPLVQPSAEQAS
jgi:hypothetical protein